MSVLGVYDGHNAGAALISDRGTVIAAVEEERFSRIKNHDARPGHNAPPDRSVAFCVGASPEPITAIAFGLERPEALSRMALLHFDQQVANGQAYRLRRAEDLGISIEELRAMPEITQRSRVATLQATVAAAGVSPGVPVSFVDHHAAHAGGAYHLSGAARALVITLDGKGDDFSGSISVAEEHRIARTLAMPTEDSLGHLYSAFTVACGLRPQRDEGKLQAMAASGQINHRIWQWLESRFGLDTRTGAIRGRLNEGLVVGPYPDRRPDLHNSLVRDVIGSTAVVDVAATVQLFLEQLVCGLVSWHVEKTGLRTLVLAGGVFANVSLNRRIAEECPVDEMHVHPAMTDAGIALGAAAVAASDGGIVPTPLKSLALGPSYTDEESAAAFTHAGYQVARPLVPPEHVLAARIGRGEVVARFTGGAEYGPRALGNRSILASATDPQMPQKLNAMLRRSSVMPFAPMARQRDAGLLFRELSALAAPTRYMTVAIACTSHTRLRYPAIVHTDGTARPQLLGSDEPLTALIDELERTVGSEMVINTSYNLHDEPMVCSPTDAAQTARLAGIHTVQVGGSIAQLP